MAPEESTEAANGAPTDWQAEAEFWRGKYLELQEHTAQVVSRLSGSPPRQSTPSPVASAGSRIAPVLAQIVRAAAAAKTNQSAGTDEPPRHARQEEDSRV